MNPRNLCLLLALLLVLFTGAQSNSHCVARFNFNNGSTMDEIHNRPARLVSVFFAMDRFGNKNSAVFLPGNMFSYINLGTQNYLKPKEGTISLWITIENETWAGAGVEYNPVLLTKSHSGNDFYEAYSIYYMLRSRRLIAVATEDSIHEVGLFDLQPFARHEWHHVAISYDRNYFCLYVDGKLAGKLPKNFETRFLEGDSVMIGNTANKKNKRFLNGIVDDIEFFDKVLSEKEISELYDSPNPNRNRIIVDRLLICLSILVFFGLLVFFIRWYVRKRIEREKHQLEMANKVLEDELRINRALMNPHFVFNSLNTLHNYILMNNTEKASDYLLKFSKLIRKILESSLNDSISLELEIELIQLYLELENMRFQEHIKYSINIDPRLVPSAITIPVMMLQPFIENSIWHGLVEKNGDKVISVNFTLYQNAYVRCLIDDNGIGRKDKPAMSSGKQSLAIGFIKHRLELLNRIHHLNASLNIIDKQTPSGTIVEIILPILNQK